jgi:hypothetical protein
MSRNAWPCVCRSATSVCDPLRRPVASGRVPRRLGRLGPPEVTEMTGPNADATGPGPASPGSAASRDDGHRHAHRHRAPPGAYLRAVTARMTTVSMSCHWMAWNPAAAKQPGRKLLGAGLVVAAGDQGGHQQGRGLVGEHGPAAGCQDPGALRRVGPLVGPVIKGGRADYQVEGSPGRADPPPCPPATAACRRWPRPARPRSWPGPVPPLPARRPAGSELAQQVPGPAPDIKNPLRRSHQRQGQVPQSGWLSAGAPARASRFHSYPPQRPDDANT